MTFRTYNGNTHTENGWRICNSDQCVTLWYAGKPVLVRDGDAATVLKWWIDWYNANVEPIKSQIWGWSATNDVPGTPGRNDGSNHLSGTGIDLNAPWHPWTVDASRNFTPGQIAAIRRGLALAEGNLFWGQDWGRKDPMHFQLNGGTARVKELRSSSPHSRRRFAMARSARVARQLRRARHPRVQHCAAAT